MEALLQFIGKFSDGIATTPWYFQAPLWAIAAIIVYVLCKMIWGSR